MVSYLFLLQEPAPQFTCLLTRGIRVRLFENYQRALLMTYSFINSLHNYLWLSTINLTMSKHKKLEHTNYNHFYSIKTKFEYPMVFLTLLLLALIVAEVSFDLSPLAHNLLSLFDFLIWSAFLCELIVLTYLAPDKLRYLKSAWYNILIVLLPSLRLTRLFYIESLLIFEKNLVNFARLFATLLGTDTQLVRVFPLLARSAYTAKSLIKKHKINSIFIVVVGLILILGPLGAVFERQSEAGNIRTISDGIWWGIVSITTVGYGDRFPVTFPGRVIGIMLMTIGVVTFSTLTATIASGMVEDAEAKDREKLNEHLEAIEKKLSNIERELK